MSLLWYENNETIWVMSTWSISHAIYIYGQTSNASHEHMQNYHINTCIHAVGICLYLTTSQVYKLNRRHIITWYIISLTNSSSYSIILQCELFKSHSVVKFYCNY